MDGDSYGFGGLTWPLVKALAPWREACSNRRAMRKSLFGFALACVFAAGCKDSSSKPTTGPAADDSTDTAHRSGKIDLGSRRPSSPGDTHADTGSGSGSGSGERPKLEDLEDRRKARLAQFDTDGDGKISEQERKVARHKRAEDMRTKADANGDGKVTIDELSNGTFRRMDPAAIDTNKDGDISVDELDVALEARSRQWGNGRLGRIPGADRGDRMRRGPRGGSGSATD